MGSSSRASHHPIVEELLRKGRTPLSDIATLGDENDPMIHALARAGGVLTGRQGTVREALEAMRAVPLHRPCDPELAIIFFSIWGELCMRAHEIAEHETIVRRMRALLTKKMPAELHVAVQGREALQISLRGDKVRAVEMLRAAVAVAPADSPMRITMMGNLAFFLAQLGRETEIDGELEALTVGADEHHSEWLPAARLVQFVETGRTKEAFPLLQQVKHLRARRRDQLSAYSGLLAVLDHRWDLLSEDREEEPDWNSPIQPVREENIPAWARPAYYLVSHQPLKALAAARRRHEQQPNSASMAIGFDGFNLLRAELANGNAGAAHRILDQRRECGNRHYLDDLFAARIALLDGHPESAARHFAKLLASVERYLARGRLDFELRLAPDVSPTALVDLTRNSSNVPDRLEPGKVFQGIQEGSPVEGTARLIGRSRATEEIRRAIRKYAPLAPSVLISGETGTGKELVARALHEAGPRQGRPFIAVNCGAISESLVESELFGYKKGAFTGAESARRGLFEEAGKGSILLDEIGDISPRLQITLLRVLETGEVRPVGSSRTRRVCCRMLLATNADLDAMARDGRFRKDLYYRLKRLEIHIPPLRERREDILPLADHFLAFGRRDRERPVLSPSLREALLRHEWPGNVRELRNAVECLRMTNSDKLRYEIEDAAFFLGATSRAERTPADNGAEASPVITNPRPEDSADIEIPLAEGRSPLGRRRRLQALFERHGRLTRADVARLLGVSNRTATRYLKTLCDEGIVERVMPTPAPRTHYFQLKVSQDQDAVRGSTEAEQEE